MGWGPEDQEHWGGGGGIREASTGRGEPVGEFLRFTLYLYPPNPCYLLEGQMLQLRGLYEMNQCEVGGDNLLMINVCIETNSMYS